MFSALRQGNLFYILHNGETPKLEVGQVSAIGQPQPRYNTSYPVQPFNPETTIDVSVKVGDKTYEFKQLSSQMTIENRENMVLSDNKEAMLAEVESMLRTSRQIIESVGYHEKVVAACDTMLRELNPHFAKEKDQEEKIGLLENKMTNIEGTLGDIMSMLSKALDKRPAKKEEQL